MNESDVSPVGPRVDAASIVELRHAMGMSQEEFGDLLGVSRKTVGNWERGGAIQKSSRRRLAELAATVVIHEPDAEKVDRRISDLEARVDYLEAIVLKQRTDELAARRDKAGLSVPPRNLQAVADSNVGADEEVEGRQEEP